MSPGASPLPNQARGPAINPLNSPGAKRRDPALTGDEPLGRIIVDSTNGRMGLNIKNEEVERLAAEVAALAGETKTEAIRRALAERRERLRYRGVRRDRAQSVLAFLAREIWPRVPKAQRGRRPSVAEEAEILGYGPEGV